VPRPEVEATVEAAVARLEREAAVRARLEAGELGLDIYGLRDRLRELGVVQVDAEEPSRGE
jgi:4-hydroxy-4-methyl-2-oxoglutarate aldolase